LAGSKPSQVDISGLNEAPQGGDAREHSEVLLPKFKLKMAIPP